MGIKKFIQSVTESLELDDFKKLSKKKSIKNLLKKLNSKKDAIDKSLKEKLDKKAKKELLEEREIILCQIKKGEKILSKLNT